MFEASLDPPRLPARSAAKGVLFSLASHTAILAVALLASRHAPPKPEPKLPEVTFRRPPPPPPPPLGGGGAAHATEAPRKTAPTTRLTPVPRDPSKSAPAPDPTPKAAPADAPGDPGGKEGGVPGGMENGVIGGTEGGVIGGSLVDSAPVAARAAPTTVVLPFGEGMNRPLRLGGPEPVYPREAREAKIEGTLLVKCVITTSGALQGCRVIKSLPFLDEPVLQALAQQRYTPVTFQGRPVTVEYVIPFKFKLQ